MFNFEAIGTVEAVEPPRSWTTPDGKTFRVAVLVLREDGDAKYPKSLAISFWGEDSDKPSFCQQGDRVAVSCRASSRSSSRKDGTQFWSHSISGDFIRNLSRQSAPREEKPYAEAVLDEAIPF